jgi:hypothetical protein
MNKIARPRKDFTEVFRPAAMEQRKKRVKTGIYQFVVDKALNGTETWNK